MSPPPVQRPSAGFPARPVASADQLARLHVTARGRHRTRRVAATRRRSEERAAHMDRVWRRPDAGRRRPGPALSGRTSVVRRTRRMARSAAYFFGRIHRPTSAAIGTAGLASVLSAAQKLQDANWALPANGARDWGTIAGRGFRLLIPGVDGVPARAYLSILIVFSLLIGPANYWFLWRKRQQVLLVLTAPLISAMFIVVLGCLRRGRRRSWSARPRGDVHDAGSGQTTSLHARQHVAVRRRHDARRRAALPAGRGGVPDWSRRHRQP